MPLKRRLVKKLYPYPLFPNSDGDLRQLNLKQIKKSTRKNLKALVFLYLKTLELEEREFQARKFNLIFASLKRK